MIPVTTARLRRGLVTVAATAATALAGTACETVEPAPSEPMSVDTYVEVMSELADLRRFPPPGAGHLARMAAADSARRLILERHGVTVDELLTYAELVGARPELMVEITSRIAAITDSLARERTGGRVGESDEPGEAGAAEGGGADRAVARGDTATGAPGTPDDAASPRVAPVPQDTGPDGRRLPDLRRDLPARLRGPADDAPTP